MKPSGSSFVHDIISNLDGVVNCGHKHTDLIIMDFSKAFDNVPHRRLLHKLDLEDPPTSGSTRGSLGALNNFFRWPSLRSSPSAIRCAPGIDRTSGFVPHLHK